MTSMTREWVRKAEADLGHVDLAVRGRRRLYDGICFHCQQAAEKYLKALLQEAGQPIPRTHDLLALLTLPLPIHPTLRPLRRGLGFLTQFAVEHRYPGKDATRRQPRPPVGGSTVCGKPAASSLA